MTEGQTYGHSLTAVTDKSVPQSHSCIARRLFDLYMSAEAELLERIIIIMNCEL